ncbi:sulfur carrier protein ThiS [Nocardiopsis sp. YSL2]|uniref:sulfur carrier protein ThiS n=1 Tax=Nocardiopsis sp. YSL2 TaxID=2939492 RepID=UPI0026F47A61|nr:sulfur carrier protein ThiS [Nocardiopsis sp. YSL2]
MELIINGAPRDVTADTTVESVVRELTGTAEGAVPGGIAVSLNDEVVRRAAWSETPLRDRDRVDVLTAVQGG